MKSKTTPSFRKALARLPSDVQDRARKAFDQFEADPNLPGLQFKRIHTRRRIYSARVTDDYRAVAIRRDDAWVWFWIGSHSNYDQVISRV